MFSDPKILKDSLKDSFKSGMAGNYTSLLVNEGEGNGNPLQYSCLENPHGQSSQVGYSPWGCKEWDRTERLTLSVHIGEGFLHFVVLRWNCFSSVRKSEEGQPF